MNTNVRRFLYRSCSLHAHSFSCTRSKITETFLPFFLSIEVNLCVQNILQRKNLRPILRGGKVRYIRENARIGFASAQAMCTQRNELKVIIILWQRGFLGFFEIVFDLLLPLWVHSDFRRK